MNRRDFLKLLLLLSSLALSSCKPKNNIKNNDKLINAFGLRNGKNKFSKIYAAGPPAEVLLYALAPERLIGWTAKKSDLVLSLLSNKFNNLPFLGGINGRGTTVSFETLLKKEVDLIVDLGIRNDEYLSKAKKIAKQLNIPYLLIYGKLTESISQIKELGKIINSPYTNSLANLATKALTFANKVSREINHNIKVYYARGIDGLETASMQSIHAEVISLLGAHNVADSIENEGLIKVSMEQILKWDPDLIITQDEELLKNIKKRSSWKMISAFKNNKIHLLPKIPFGFIDGPPSINRLLGIYLLAPIFQKIKKDTYIYEIKALYEALYHTQFTDFHINMLGLHKI